jgi:superfamily I DNA/RNA helicase
VSFSVSAEHHAIFEFVRCGIGHGLIEATAGAGKTSTLLELSKMIPSDIQAAYVAFAKQNVDDVRGKLPNHILATTLHGLGYAALRNAIGGQFEVKPNKYADLAGEMLTEQGFTGSEMQKTRRLMNDLLMQCRFAMVDPNNRALVEEVAINRNFEMPGDPLLIEFAFSQLPRLQKRGLEMVRRGVIDFSDQIYAPLVQNHAKPRFDSLFIDEAQDLSAMQLELVCRLIQPSGRMLFVGDRYQAIMGFAGADFYSLDSIQQRTNATTFTLSISHRCPKLHVELAKHISPNMKASADVHDGEIASIEYKALIRWVAKSKDCLVLARTNATLTEAFFDLIDGGVACAFKGKNIERYIRLAERLPDNYSGWLGSLSALQADEYKKLDKLTTKQREARAEDIKDMFYTMRVYVINAIKKLKLTPAKLVQFIKDMHQPRGNNKIRLTTVHSAKGLEADEVFIIDPLGFIAVASRSTEALHAEAAVQFVALTRSKRLLVLVEAKPSESEWK